jgi:hypothetical protein
MIPCEISGPSSPTSFLILKELSLPHFRHPVSPFSLIPPEFLVFLPPLLFSHSLSLFIPFVPFSAINSILNNDSWYQKKNVIDFISRVGRQIRLGDMLSRASVKERIKSEEGMSFSEFSYQIFQAYDWLYLRDKYNCCIQVIIRRCWMCDLTGSI